MEEMRATERMAGAAKKKGLRRVTAIVAIVLAMPLQADESTRLMLGLGDGVNGSNARSVQLGIARDFDTSWHPFPWLTMVPYWEGSVGHVAPTGRPDRFEDTWTVAAQGGVRVPLAGDGRLFTALATGPVLLSEQTLGTGDDAVDWGSNFAFRSHLEIGWFPLEQRHLFLSYRLQHSSNAGLGDSNPGIDFQVFTLGWMF